MPRRKLLLADDSITIQKVVNLTFADEGIDVIAVSDGDAALKKLHEESPDIVLADVNMPGLNGYELCAEVKRRGFDEQVPVILLVGSFEPFDEDEAERVGADGYLTKPFQSISQLVTKVTELLGIEPAPISEFEDTAELIGESPEDFVPSDEVDAAFDEVTDVPEAPSFDSLDVGEDISETIEETTSEKENFELESESQLDEAIRLDDSDEFEMSEAFADDENIETLDTPVSEENQIEEVTDDFFRTQPFTESDLQEISVDSESLEDLKSEYEFPEDDEVVESESAFDLTQSEEEVSFGEYGEVDSSLDTGAESTEIESTEFETEKFAEGFESTAEIKNESEAGDDFGEHMSFREETVPEPMFPADDNIPAQQGRDAADVDPEVSENDERGFDFQPAVEAEAADTEPDEVFVSVDLADQDTGVGELPQPEGASVLDLDEFNLLELPPVDNLAQSRTDSVVGEKATARLDQRRFVPDPADSSPLETEPVVEAEYNNGPDEALNIADSNESESSGNVLLADDTLSRDMVEAITQRVIETLSEKAIREIAWEVVPDMADLILKKLAEEQINK